MIFGDRARRICIGQQGNALSIMCATRSAYESMPLEVESPISSFTLRRLPEKINLTSWEG